MSRRLRGFFGALKDTASLGKAVAAATSPAATLAVLRATTHLPAAEPSHPRHVDALLAFGRGSRLSAAALASALADRLLSTRDPTVALKSLLAIHHLLSRGAFIIRDQLPAALLRHPSSGRNPLVLSSFPLSSSFTLSSCVRWYARLLELLLSTPFFPASSSSAGGGSLQRRRSFTKSEVDEDRLSSLLDRDLISELDALVGIVEEMSRTPITVGGNGNKLLAEVLRLVEDDRVTAEGEILLRIKEMAHRLGSLGFADSVELVYVIRRFEECRLLPLDRKPTAEDWYWIVVGDLMGRVERVVVRKEEEERRKVKREAVSSSARVTGPAVADSNQVVVFGSSRWMGPLSKGMV